MTPQPIVGWKKSCRWAHVPTGLRTTRPFVYWSKHKHDLIIERRVSVILFFLLEESHLHGGRRAAGDICLRGYFIDRLVARKKSLQGGVCMDEECWYEDRCGNRHHAQWTDPDVSEMSDEEYNATVAFCPFPAIDLVTDSEVVLRQSRYDGNYYKD